MHYLLYVGLLMHRAIHSDVTIMKYLVLTFYIYCSFNVRQKTDARYSYRLDVCLSVRPSVCLSVTRWYCVEMAQPIVKLFSPPYDSSFVRSKHFPGIPMGTSPTGALNTRGRKKLQFPTNISQ